MDPLTPDEGGRAATDRIAGQLPQLYALARALDADAADDLVQDTVTAALDDLDTEPSGSSLAVLLAHLAGVSAPVDDPPPVPVAGRDPDADEPELFYPGFYTDGPDAGAWVDPVNAFGEPRFLRPEDDLATSEVLEVLAAALDGLDPLDADLLTRVDLDGRSFRVAVTELGVPVDEGQERLGRARLAVRTAVARYLRS